MSFAIKDRVQETTVTTGTGTVTLLGATQAHQSFSAIGNGNTTCYGILSGDGINWEVGIGTYTLSGTTLSRTTILASSNAGSAISLVGTSLVFCTNPAEQVSSNGLWDQIIGATRGMIPLRGASAWAGLAIGAANTFLGTDGTDAIWQKKHYIVSFSHPSTSVLTASEVCGHHRVTKGITFQANFGSYNGHTSQSGGTANATGSTVISVDKAASATPNTFSQIGTITIAAGGVVPTFATSGGTTQALAQGDVVRLVGPSSADATFAGLYASLVAAET